MWTPIWHTIKFEHARGIIVDPHCMSLFVLVFGKQCWQFEKQIHVSRSRLRTEGATRCVGYRKFLWTNGGFAARWLRFQPGPWWQASVIHCVCCSFTLVCAALSLYCLIRMKANHSQVNHTEPSTWYLSLEPLKSRSRQMLVKWIVAVFQKKLKMPSGASVHN